MVPNIRPNGSSFRGAGRYYLHDKGGASGLHPTTSERVAWTVTRNLLNEDPELAIDEMWHTAEDAARLKQASGHEWRKRRDASPVKTISLAWAPHQSPTREQMLDAADSFLAHMGAREHQALILPHSDTAHPHIHIILNRVHPETGLVLNDWQEQRRAQRWAYDYERAEGQILCAARIERYGSEQERGENALQPNGMPYPFAKLAQEQERAFDTGLAAEATQDAHDKEQLSARHQAEREAFLASGKSAFRQARQAAYREVREEFKELWREHFADEKQMVELLEQQGHLVHRQALAYCRAGDLEASALVQAEFADLYQTTLDRISEHRANLRQDQIETTRTRQDEACKSLIELRREAFQLIKDRQKEERSDFRTLTAERDQGLEFDVERLHELIAGRAVPAANDNISQLDLNNAPQERDPTRERAEPEINPFSQEAHRLFGEFGFRDPEANAPRKDVTDAMAGGISFAIEMAARFMEGLFDNATPYERAVAKAWAIREHDEAPKREAAAREEQRQHDFVKHALASVRQAEAEQELRHKRDREDRDRGRDRER